MTKNIKFAVVIRRIGIKLLKEKLKDNNIPFNEDNIEEIFDDYKNHKMDFELWKGKNVRKFSQFVGETLKKSFNEENIHIGFAFNEIAKTKQFSKIFASVAPSGNGKDYFLENILIKLLEENFKDTKNIVRHIITDLRFFNEFQAVIDYNKSDDKKDHIKQYLSNLNIPNTIEEAKEYIIKGFELNLENKYDKKFLILILREMESLYKLRTKEQLENNPFDIDFLKSITVEELLKELSVFSFVRYMEDDENNLQDERYKLHGIEKGCKEFTLPDGSIRFMGSADFRHVSEQLPELLIKLNKIYLTSSQNTSSFDEVAEIINKEIEKELSTTTNKNTKTTTKNNNR